jgi:hypothetical protein
LSATLCQSVPENYISAINLDLFFDKQQNDAINRFAKREQPKIGVPGESCKTNLFFGFFFDGTRNNYLLAEKAKEQSNVARLYDIFPGQSVQGVLPERTEWKKEKKTLFSNFFRVYVPGVASPFDKVKDSGDGLIKTLGGAFGKKGNDRIVWALLQAINNVHRFFHQRPLLSSEESTELATELSLSWMARKLMSTKWVPISPITLGEAEYYGPIRAFERILRRLHASVSPHWSRNGRPPAKVDPSIVQTIHISTFGFSRGATQARAFANWLDSLCQLDAELCGKTGRTLGGFPVKFDFLGLFDTVASVGVGNTYGNVRALKRLDGHASWADAEDSLRVPGSIAQCVHLVAGHELRRSFPLDSIAVGSNYPAGSKEIVFPGVHSDVGGGYGPKQQGKGIDANGADMLSRLPLLYMYKAARLAGVPLKLELADSVVQQKFAVKPQVIKDFNAYLSKCVNRTGSLTDIMREQQILQMEWRYWRRDRGSAPIQKSPNFARASNFDKNDLESANNEFNAELGEFEKSLKKWKGVAPAKQKAGFNNELPGEWEEIATYWPFRQPDAVVAHFFDEYVHDSRAAFKLSGADNENDTVKDLREWCRELGLRKGLHKNPWAAVRGPYVPGPPDYGMDTNRRMAAEAFDQAKRAAPMEKDLTRLIPRYINEGREPASLADAGYFRFRKIYGGSDVVLLSHWEPDNKAEERAYVRLDNRDEDVGPPTPRVA